MTHKDSLRTHKGLTKTLAQRHRGVQDALAQRHRGVQDRDPATHASTKHARNTDNTAGPPHRNTQQLNAITNHRPKFKKLQLLFGTGARGDGGTDGRIPTNLSARP